MKKYLKDYFPGDLFGAMFMIYSINIAKDFQ